MSYVRVGRTYTQFDGGPTMTGGENGWGEYSRLVLKELETLATGIQQLQSQIQELKIELSQLQAKEDKVQEISRWKARIDEITSPTQLKELQDQVTELKIFKTKAITTFAVVQIMMGIAMAILKFII